MDYPDRPCRYYSSFKVVVPQMLEKVQESKSCKMNAILSKYNAAIKITKVSSRQKKLFAAAKGIIAADTETTGLFFHTPSIFHSPEGDVEVFHPFPFGISLAFYYGKKVVMAWGRYGTDLYDECKKVLANNVDKTWHNARYDLRVCKENNILVGGRQHCTLTMSRIYWDRRRSHALQALTEFLCPELSGWEVTLKKEMTKIKSSYTRKGYPQDYANYSFIPDEIIAPYAATDAFMALMVYELLSKEMERNFSSLYEREIKILYAVTKIEERGMAYDSKKSRIEAQKLTKQIKELTRKIHLITGDEDFNPNSPTQVHLALNSLGITDRQLTVKGAVTTGADKLREINAQSSATLSKRASRFIESLLLLRAFSKTVGTYLIPLAERAERNSGIVYTSINPTDTVTGRPASKNPNLLNISKPDDKKTLIHNPIRECFVCRPGFANYYFDVSQQEMAFFGLLADDTRILEAYTAGEDIHQYMADQIGLDRGQTKGINFGVLYGLGIKAMAANAGWPVSKAKEIMSIYLDEFPSVKEFQARCKYELYQSGYVEDFFGRRYHVPPNQAYKAVNALVQGGCAQAFKIGLLNVDALLVSRQHIILPVYDELQIETPIYSKAVEAKWCDNIVSAMINVPQLLDRGLRLRVDVEKSETNWAEKKKLKLTI